MKMKMKTKKEKKKRKSSTFSRKNDLASTERKEKSERGFKLVSK